MEAENNQISNNFYLYSILIIFFISITAVFLLVFDINKPARYDWLFLLPMMFMILSLVLGKPIYSSIIINPGIALVIGQLFIRNVVTPMMMYFGNYYSQFFISIDTYYGKAIFLMIYEMVICFLVIRYTIRKKNRIILKSMTNRKLIKFNIYGFVLLCITVLCITLWYAFPIVQSNYWTIFDMLKSGVKDNAFSHFDYIGTGSIERMGATLFLFLFGFIRILVPAYLIVRLHNRFSGNICGLLVSMVLIFLQLFFISGSAAETLFTMIVLFVLTAQLFSKYRKRMFGVMLVAIVFIIVSVFALVYLNYNLAVVYELLYKYKLSNHPQSLVYQ